MAAALAIEDCVNTACPWSGKPVSPDSLTLYREHVVGFCNPGCRDKFVAATAAFDAVIPAPGAE
ncbi:MAG: glutathione S-transferase [Pseudomonadota bacterium]